MLKTVSSQLSAALFSVVSYSSHQENPAENSGFFLSSTSAFFLSAAMQNRCTLLSSEREVLRTEKQEQEGNGLQTVLKFVPLYKGKLF